MSEDSWNKLGSALGAPFVEGEFEGYISETDSSDWHAQFEVEIELEAFDGTAA